MDGVDLTPLWSGAEVEVSRAAPLCWEHEGHAAVRDGGWKIVRATATAAWELYDIENDRVEEHDLAATHPTVVTRLAGSWQAWAMTHAVLT